MQSVEECTRWFSSTGLFCVVPSGSAHSCACEVLYRPRLSLVASWSDADGRFVQCEFSFQAKLFRVACIYAPNRNLARDTFFSDVDVFLGFRLLLPVIFFLFLFLITVLFISLSQSLMPLPLGLVSAS